MDLGGTGKWLATADGHGGIMLDDAQVNAFFEDGFVRIDGAFSRETAAECRDLIWRDMDAAPDDPATWPRPVAGLGDHAEAPFKAAANSLLLHAAFDVLVGQGCWAPREVLGGFVVRFPGGEPAVVDGWHIDASFPGEDLDGPGRDRPNRTGLPPLASDGGSETCARRPARRASAPKPSTPGPGRPLGSKNRRPAARHDVGRVLATGEAYSRPAHHTARLPMRTWSVRRWHRSATKW
ncbi:hypothetical protein YWIDRAFT_07877 [Streptomyces sp. SceaMP-e96]|nr:MULTISPECIES: hypothetical protein [unclassified Streptomyces]SCK51761.1 hypothetical protein YWIDRAFT_07877 [Streptomyces sp. SceaMP-e96]